MFQSSNFTEASGVRTVRHIRHHIAACPFQQIDLGEIANEQRHP
ncbi:MAG: hypothetical protein U0074_06775 [Kouleothrix sp.]